MGEILIFIFITFLIVIAFYFISFISTVDNKEKEVKIDVDISDVNEKIEICKLKEIQNMKINLSTMEAVEIAKAALTKLRIKDLRELIPFLETEEQLGSLIRDFHNELIPIYEDLMQKRGLRKDLIGHAKWKELLNYCIGFGEVAIHKLPGLTLNDLNFNEQNIRSSLNEREIKKVASWSEIKKRIDSDN